jgi:hypothetical protein
MCTIHIYCALYTCALYTCHDMSRVRWVVADIPVSPVSSARDSEDKSLEAQQSSSESDESPLTDPITHSEKSTCQESSRFIGDAAHAFAAGTGSSTGLSAEGVEYLKQMFDKRRAVRDPQDYVMDRRDVRGTVKTRNPDLAHIFANQSELDLYRFCTDARLSQFRSEQLLGIVTKV